jgi:hypothetical protein
MTELEKSVLNELSGDRYSDYSNYYIAAAEALRDPPEEPAVEILNAIDHFSSALKLVAQAPDQAERQFKNGQAHMILGTLICLALIINHWVQVTTNYVEAIEDTLGELLTDDRTELVGLRRCRNSLLPKIRPIRLSNTPEPTGNIPALEEIIDEATELATDCSNFFKKVSKIPTLRELIQRRAHDIWMKAGRPVGKDPEHWEQAEWELGRPDSPIKAVPRQP